MGVKRALCPQARLAARGAGFPLLAGRVSAVPRTMEERKRHAGRCRGPDRHRRVWERGQLRQDLPASAAQGGPEAASDRWKSARAPDRAGLRQFVKGAPDRFRCQGCKRILDDLHVPPRELCTSRPPKAISRQPASKGGDGSVAIGRSGMAALNRWTRPAYRLGRYEIETTACNRRRKCR